MTIMKSAWLLLLGSLLSTAPAARAQSYTNADGIIYAFI